jgi:hypothetical protein
VQDTLDATSALRTLYLISLYSDRCTTDPPSHFDHRFPYLLLFEDELESIFEDMEVLMRPAIFRLYEHIEEGSEVATATSLRMSGHDVLPRIVGG